MQKSDRNEENNKNWAAASIATSSLSSMWQWENQKIIEENK